MAKHLSTAYKDELNAQEGMKQTGLNFITIQQNHPDHQQPEDAAVHFHEKSPLMRFRRLKAATTPTEIDLEEEMTGMAGVLRMVSNYAQNLHVFNNLKEPFVLELHPWRRPHAQADSEL